MEVQHAHHWPLVATSILIAIFASYVALDLTNSVSLARGRVRLAWLFGGSLAMGVGIWSMHFVAMLAYSVPGITIAYDVPLLFLSVLVAIAASLLTLIIVKGEEVGLRGYLLGSLSMGAAIAGMHYIGIASMRLSATIDWRPILVAASILIAIVASFVALTLAFRLRHDLSRRGIWYRAAGAVVMGLAISGMHYTAMAAMILKTNGRFIPIGDHLLATRGLAMAVTGTTLLILGLALAGSVVDKTLARRIALTSALQQAIRSRDEFISVASHELKTPITTMRMQAQLLERTIRDRGITAVSTERILKLLETSTRQLDRLTRLVNDMLDISRVSTGKLSLEFSHGDLSGLLNDVIERFQLECQRAQCELHSDIEPGISGNLDLFRIEQVITNLLGNAIKYGSEQPIEVKLRKCSADWAELQVTDHGIGISQEAQDRIFGRFERAVPATTGIAGLGLGLYIARSIMDAHQGSVSVKSKPGEGSTFTVKIPLRLPEQQRKTAA